MSEPSRNNLLTRHDRRRTVVVPDDPPVPMPAVEAAPVEPAVDTGHHRHTGVVPDPSVTDYGPTIAFQNERLTIVYFGIFVGVGGFLAMLHSAFYLSAHDVAGPSVLMALLLVVAVGAPFTSFALTRLLDIRSWLGGDKTFVQWARTITFSLWGGLQGGFNLSLAVAATFGIAPLALLDAVVLGLPLAQAIGRIGCLNYGCCYGRICSNFSPLAIRYRNPTTKAMRYDPQLAGIALHPTPIYSTMVNLAIYGTMLYLWLSPGDRPAGLLAATYMTLYGLKRFCMEFIRSDFPRPHALRLTMWQFLSAGLAIAGSVLLLAVVPGQPVVQSLDADAGIAALALGAPLALVAALVMTAVYSVHGKEVGSW